MLHDSAAANTPEVPEPTGPSYESPTELKLSTVGKTIGQNYRTYHEVSEQLIQLQDWIRDQVVLYNTVKPSTDLDATEPTNWSNRFNPYHQVHPNNNMCQARVKYSGLLSMIESFDLMDR